MFLGLSTKNSTSLRPCLRMQPSVVVPPAPPIAVPGSTNKTGTVGVQLTDVKVSLPPEAQKEYISHLFPVIHKGDLLGELGAVAWTTQGVR